jgi:RNA polymerase sigma-70 factor, ECF subfamily
MSILEVGVDVAEYAEVPGRQVANNAFASILSSGLRPLFRGAYRVLGNVADAEDAVQDALLAAYTHLDQFRGQSKMSTWLTTIVQNSARMQLRRRPRQVHVPLDAPVGEDEEYALSQQLADHRPNPEDEYRTVELGKRLADLQTELTPTLRKAFQLRDVNGLSIRETAQILGVPDGTVKARSARARKKIMQSMRRSLKPRTRNLTDRAQRHALASI